MNDSPNRIAPLDAVVCERALDARDPRFDGVFFVGITSTRIYCRPVCPARVSYRDRRRFFSTAAAAECAGFRPCRRCRPELAPGRALVDAVSRLAQTAAHRIAAGALNGRSVADLARDLHVGERQLRRAFEREVGVSPVELAQTHRLLLARRLLTDTALSISRIAYTSGFQSLRRFNAAFRERYGVPPSSLRKAPRSAAARPGRQGRIAGPDPEGAFVRLTLAYRAPFAWDLLLLSLKRGLTPGMETVQGRRYGRVVRLDGCTGLVFVEDTAGKASRTGSARAPSHLNVDISPTLVPVLMPLIARLRQLFDLDAEPGVVDEHLERNGLGPIPAGRRGIRIPGAFDGFEVALRTLLADRRRSATATSALAAAITRALGESVDTGCTDLTHLAPGPERVALAGASGLVRLGAPPRRAAAIAEVGLRIAAGTLRLDAGSGPVETQRALMSIDGIGERAATIIVMRTLGWPDAFPFTDRALLRAAGAADVRELRSRSEPWRPWRAYAALHLWLDARTPHRAT